VQAMSELVYLPRIAQPAGSTEENCQELELNGLCLILVGMMSSGSRRGERRELQRALQPAKERKAIEGRGEEGGRRARARW
jgi:hypothetical protein